MNGVSFSFFWWLSPSFSLILCECRVPMYKKKIENCVCNLKQLCQHWLTGILFHWRNAQQRFFCLLSLPLSLEYKYIKNKDINESTSCFVSILCALSDYCCCCCCHVESIFSILKSCNSIWMMPESLSMLLFVRIRIQQ